MKRISLLKTRHAEGFGFEGGLVQICEAMNEIISSSPQDRESRQPRPLACV